MNDDEVKPAEQLSRFIFSKKHFDGENKLVKYAAFLPHEGGTSVFRTDGLSDDGIWNIGENDVAPSRLPVTLKCRGDIRAEIVFEQGLHIRPDDSPPRHSEIIGWPEEHDARMLIALEIAGKATLVLK